jgi:predicted extracellular nuclease
MIKSTILIAFLISVSLTALSQKNVNSLVVVSYNVENLFDTVNSPLFDDDAFTPEGSKKWTSDRYEKKVTDLAMVLGSIPGSELPAVIGLTEIENRKVLEDLINDPKLRNGVYEIIHEDGVDPRGIECALLFRPEYFKYLSHNYIPIEDPVDPEYLYRSILHVQGKGPDGLTLHLFMNHWKSRSGGVAETERQRIAAASTLQKQLDLLSSTESESRVIIMGDFNDEPTNQSIIHGLSALNKRKNIHPGDFYNLFYDTHNLERKGTYNYRGTWNMLDQFIVSYNMLNQESGLTTGFEQGKIFSEEWMMYDNEKYGEKLPSSTYGGPNYYGGPSDHLPIYVTFTW